jgi:hypothetical protein
MGPNCDWSKTHRIEEMPKIKDREACKLFLEEYGTFPPKYSDGGCWGSWAKLPDEEIKAFIQPIINDCCWGEETGLEDKGNGEDWVDWVFPQMYDIRFNSMYSPPFRAMEILIDEQPVAMGAYLAYEDEGKGIVGRWECYKGGAESGMETEFIKYINDSGELLATYRMTKSDWELVEEIWEEIHGPDELQHRVKYPDYINSAWIPAKERFKKSKSQNKKPPK